MSILIEEGIRHGCLDSITITSTVRRGGLSTSTMKSERMHERMLCSCKLRLRRASPTVGLHSGHRSLLGLRRLHAGGAKTCSYEYRFAEYEYRFAEHEHEYEYDEIRCDART